MASAPVIQYLRLDLSFDPVFDPTANLTDADAVAQIILTRLLLFLGEWWEDLSLGLPVFQSMLGQLGSATNLNGMQLAVRKVIAGSPYVTAVGAVQFSFHDGQFSFTANAQTVFGPVTVISPPPGAAAAL